MHSGIVLLNETEYKEFEKAYQLAIETDSDPDIEYWIEVNEAIASDVMLVALTAMGKNCLPEFVFVVMVQENWDASTKESQEWLNSKSEREAYFAQGNFEAYFAQGDENA